MHKLVTPGVSKQFGIKHWRGFRIRIESSERELAENLVVIGDILIPNIKIYYVTASFKDSCVDSPNASLEFDVGKYF